MNSSFCPLGAFRGLLPSRRSPGVAQLGDAAESHDLQPGGYPPLPVSRNPGRGRSSAGLALSVTATILFGVLAFAAAGWWPREGRLTGGQRDQPGDVDPVGAHSRGRSVAGRRCSRAYGSSAGCGKGAGGGGAAAHFLTSRAMEVLILTGVLNVLMKGMQSSFTLSRASSPCSPQDGPSLGDGGTPDLDGCCVAARRRGVRGRNASGPHQPVRPVPLRGRGGPFGVGPASGLTRARASGAASKKLPASGREPTRPGEAPLLHGGTQQGLPQQPGSDPRQTLCKFAQIFSRLFA